MTRIRKMRRKEGTVKGDGWTETSRAKKSASSKALWQDPKWRADMFAKQKAHGLRNYPVKL